MKRLVIGIILASFMLTGCTTKYCKPGATPDNFKKDHYECKHRARQMAQFGDVYDPFEDIAQQKECLEMKGWSRCSE